MFNNWKARLTLPVSAGLQFYPNMKLKTVYYSKGEMADTPMAIDRVNGILYINPKRYFALTDFQKKFVKYHEYGHLNLDTDSELKADEYAFRKLAGTEFRSLKQCIECLETLLDENIIGHKVRIDQMYALALKWDKEHKLDKATGAQEAASEDAMVNVVMASNSGMINQLATTFNSLNNLLNSLLIAGVIIVAMIFILKED